jgi:activating signal cointegrator 1
MKAITLTQPWATLVAIGAKRIETRSWPTNYRGPLAIHAAKGFPKWAKENQNGTR